MTSEEKHKLNTSKENPLIHIGSAGFLCEQRLHYIRSPFLSFLINSVRSDF